jgi:hypothetical protein
MPLCHGSKLEIKGTLVHSGIVYANGRQKQFAKKWFTLNLFSTEGRCINRENAMSLVKPRIFKVK